VTSVVRVRVKRVMRATKLIGQIRHIKVITRAIRVIRVSMVLRYYGC
jgi:hypothetical protein